MKKGIFIPVRTCSSRLTNKPLIEFKGKTVLKHLINRMKDSKFADIIVICTTKLKEDDILVEIARKNKIKYFRGDEKDILNRHLGTSIKYDIDLIVNVDGDDLFCDPKHVDKTFQYFINDKTIDVIKWEGLPFGAAPLGFKKNVLKKICDIKKIKDTETGWGRYLTNSDLFKIKIIQAEKKENFPEIRMSLDYPEDYEFFKKIFDILYKPGKIIHLSDVINLLNKNPDIINLNKDANKKYWKRFNKKSCNIEIDKGVK